MTETESRGQEPREGKREGGVGGKDEGREEGREDVEKEEKRREDENVNIKGQLLGACRKRVERWRE